MVNSENFKKVVDTLNKQLSKDTDIRLESYEFLKKQVNKEVLCADLISHLISWIQSQRSGATKNNTEGYLSEA